MKKILLLTLLLTVCIGLSACGRMSKPIAPEGTTYPKTYSGGK